MTEDNKQLLLEKNIDNISVANIGTLQDIIDDVCHGASEKLKGQFVKVTFGKLWEQYMSDRRTIIETIVHEALPADAPNGKQNTDYNEVFPFSVEDVERFDIIGTEGIGLSYEVASDGKSFAIKGTPKQGNEAFDVTIRCWYDGCDEDNPICHKMKLWINADPRTLWKNIEVDWDNMPEPQYKKDDTDTDYVKVEALSDGTPQMDIVAASKRGRSHAQEGKPRDDHFKLYHDDATNWYVIAVADGAGSAKYSREGSRIACETAVDHCKQLLSDSGDFENALHEYTKGDYTNVEMLKKKVGAFVYNILGNAALKSQKAIYAEAKAQSIPVKLYATTFLLAIAKRFDFGWFVATYWVGDGAICLYNKEAHTAKLMGVPDEGEYAGQTRFLTMPEIFKDGKSIYDRLRFCIEPDFTALFLMTDGVSDPMFETDANLNNPDKWDALWDRLLHDEEHPVHLVDDNEQAKDELLDWLDFWSPGNHDDRTIAILYKGEPAESDKETVADAPEGNGNISQEDTQGLSEQGNNEIQDDTVSSLNNSKKTLTTATETEDNTVEEDEAEADEDIISEHKSMDEDKTSDLAREIEVKGE